MISNKKVRDYLNNLSFAKYGKSYSKLSGERAKKIRMLGVSLTGKRKKRWWE